MPAVVWTFEGDTRDLEAALNQVQGSVNETNKDLQQTGKEGQKGFKLTEEGAKKAAKVIGGTLVAGLAAATAATVALAASAVNVAKNLNSLAKQGRRVGALASEIDTLNGAFGLLTENGVDSARVLEDVNRNLGLAASGSKDVQRAFDSLGLPDDFSGRDAISRVSLLVERIGAIQDPAQRADVASKTLGRSWRELQTVFASGEGALDTAIQQVRDAGVVSDEAAAQSEDLLDAIDLSTRAWQSLSREALEPLIPILTGVFEELGQLINGLDPDAVKSFAGSLSDLVAKLSDVAIGAIKATAAVLQLDTEMALPEGQRLGKRIGELQGEIQAINDLFVLSGDLTAENAEQFLSLTASMGIYGTILEREATLVERLNGKQLELEEIEKRSIQRSKDLIKARSAALNVTASAVGGGAAPRGGGGGAAAPTATGGGGFSTMLEDAVALAPAIGQINGQTLELVETVGLVGTAVKEDLVQAIDTAEDRFSDFQETWSEGMGSLVNAIGGLALDIISAFEDMNREVMRDRIASYEETSREIEDINQKLVDTVDAAEKKRLIAQKARLQEESEAQKEAALDAFYTQKGLAIAAASINTALAVINAFATAPNIVMGAVMAVIAGAAGAVSIATIAAEQPPSFHSGGVLRASDLQGATMDSMMIRAKPGEGVLSTAGVAAAGGAEGVDALNAGRTTGRGTTVNVIRFGTRTTEAISHQQLQSRTGKLQGAFRSVRPKVGRSIPGRR